MRLAVGIGLNSKAEMEEILALVATCLAAVEGEIAVVASSVRKAENVELAAVAQELGAPLRLLADDELAAVPLASPSGFVADTVGLAGIAEAAAGYFGPVLIGKRKSANVTCAIAEMTS